jgi:hypothetical protein
LAKHPENVEIKGDLLGNDLARSRIEADQGKHGSALHRLEDGLRRGQEMLKLAPDNNSLGRKVRAFQLFKAKILLDAGPDDASKVSIARELGTCRDGDNRNDRELIAFCSALSARLTGVQRPRQTFANTEGDIYTPRWGINLAEEAGRH